jgi:CDP-diacylglycerol--glycerol-3-phosphate 3-phosphatidyltransferase
MSNLPLWKQKLPNWLTVARILIVPPIVVLMFIDQTWTGWAAAVLFIAASITDYYDGALARKYNVSTSFGKFLDPIADKILVSSTLVMLIPSGRLDALMVVILLARDSLVSGIRSAAAADRIVIPAGTIGKWKTAIQMGAIPALLIHEPIWGLPIERIGYWILWVSVALSVISGFKYVWDYYKAPPPSLKPKQDTDDSN